MTSFLESHQSRMEEIISSTEDLSLEMMLQANLRKGCKNKEEYWWLKLRSLWFKGGDRNSSFFHKSFQAHQNQNFVEAVRTEEGENLQE